MSFPNIPDITPDINITLEDSVNLLLASIAMEEMSLSKLMDAETAKILCVLKDCRRDGAILPDAIEINQSVNSTIQNMIKLQMLLQFKLEKVQTMIPGSSTTTCTTTTCTSTTYCTNCGCCITGQWKGCIENCCDTFCGDMAVLNVSFNESRPKNHSIRYSIVGNHPFHLVFYAASDQIRLDCGNCNQITLYGKGQIRKEGMAPLCDTARFKLSVCGIQSDQPSFELDLVAESNPNLNHTSGIVSCFANHGRW
ncbi:MAG: hypothetical protein RR053_06180 [Evtepia sp.]